MGEVGMRAGESEGEAVIPKPESAGMEDNPFTFHFVSGALWSVGPARACERPAQPFETVRTDPLNQLK